LSRKQKGFQKVRASSGKAQINPQTDGKRYEKVELRSGIPIWFFMVGAGGGKERSEFRVER
jgi:hypothetical protein